MSWVYSKNMITDDDIKKLKGVFATKDDLNRFATKDDLNRFATKDDLETMEKRLKKEIVSDMAEYMQNNVIPVLNQHEKRLDRIEKHIGGFPTIA